MVRGAVLKCAERMKPAGLQVFGGNLHLKYPGSLAATGILQRARTNRPFHEKPPGLPAGRFRCIPSFSQTYFPSPLFAICCSTNVENNAYRCVVGCTVSAYIYDWSAPATV